MKRYSKTQLKEQATEVFEQYPNTEALYATSDGQFFLKQNRADLHANENKLSVMTIEKDWKTDSAKDETEKKPAHPVSVKVLQAKVKDTSDVEELKRWLKEEQALEHPRKTAFACLEERIKELEEQNTEKTNEKT